MKPAAVVTVIFSSLALSGCAAPILGPLTLSHISTIASATTMTFKGKGVGEVALDVATGRDCRFIDGILREGRDICETPGSTATNKDFKGVLALLRTTPADAPETPAGGEQPAIMLAANAPAVTVDAPSDSEPVADIAALPGTENTGTEVNRARSLKAYRRMPSAPIFDPLPLRSDGVTEFWSLAENANDGWSNRSLTTTASRPEINIPGLDQLPEPVALPTVHVFLDSTAD